MNLDGIGSSHNSDAHQVTGCMHDHTHDKKTGAAGVSAANIQTFQTRQQQQQAEFSLTGWLQNILGSGKKLLRGIWGNNQTDISVSSGDKEGREQLMAQVGASTADDGRGNVAKNQALQINPYFQTLQENGAAAHMPPLQRLRLKVKGVAGQLAGKLPGRFFRFQTRNSFQTKPEQKPKEDLRKRSKYRKDELEIDCILTDESYLMDSYDRKGEYSQLTTKK